MKLLPKSNHVTMSSLSNKNVAQSKLIPRIGVVDTVFAINELIFMILDALHEPVDPPSRRLLHNTRKYPTSRWLSQNERNYRNCILVNRRWCNCAQRYLWRDLAFPRVAFNAVLQQFETTTSTTVEGIVGVSVTFLPLQSRLMHAEEPETSATT